MQITKNAAKKTAKKPKPVRVVKDSLMPTALDKARIREAVQEVLRARLAGTAGKKKAISQIRESPREKFGTPNLVGKRQRSNQAGITTKQGLVMD